MESMAACRAGLVDGAIECIWSAVISMRVPYFCRMYFR